MSKTACPGQDTRYWRPDDIFSIKCADCGTTVEFFKDEATRKCKGCGNQLRNPKLSMGCAQWCEHAEKCLGFDPAAAGTEFENSEESASLADEIIGAIKLKFGGNSSELENASIGLENAKQRLSEGNASPRIVLPAVLLLDIDYERIKSLAAESPIEDTEEILFPEAKNIMADIGLDKHSTEDVLEILKHFHLGEYIDSPEFRAVYDTCKLL